MFTLHPQLAADCFEIGDLTLCRVLLMNNCLFPWLILVPRRENLVELLDLSAVDRQQLMNELAQAGEALKELFQPHKLNVAALGNVVAQLHVHVIVRFRHDSAWPQPAWGKGVEPYETTDADILISRVRQQLALSKIAQENRT